MSGDVLRGGPIRRPSQILIADLDDSELTAPSPDLIAAVKAHDHDKIRELTQRAREEVSR